MARRKRKPSEVSDVRSDGPSSRPMEGYRGYRSKGGYSIPSDDGFGNPYRPGPSKPKKVRRRKPTIGRVTKPNRYT